MQPLQLVEVRVTSQLTTPTPWRPQGASERMYGDVQWRLMTAHTEPVAKLEEPTHEHPVGWLAVKHT